MFRDPFVKIELNKENVIFLDIDGVLNSFWADQEIERYEAIFGKYTQWSLPNILHFTDYKKGEVCLGSWVEINLLGRLKSLICETDAVVVGISSWFGENSSIYDISNFLGVRIHDTIDSTGGTLDRGRSVEDYVKKHNIKNYCILDDSHEEHYEGFLLEEKLVRVNPEVGLSWYDIEKALKIIN